MHRRYILISWTAVKYSRKFIFSHLENPVTACRNEIMNNIGINFTSDFEVFEIIPLVWKCQSFVLHFIAPPSDARLVVVFQEFECGLPHSIYWLFSTPNLTLNVKFSHLFIENNFTELSYKLWTLSTQSFL